MSDATNLMSDVDMAKFLVNGYHLVQLDVAEDVNDSIALELDGLDSNPGDAITDVVPDLLQVLKHPKTHGALQSLLGSDYEIQSHRHWHCRPAGMGHMQWHQDGTNNRDRRPNRLLGLYYPRDVTEDMGPTIIVPGTQFRNAPTDRMATYTNIRGQIPLIVKAGTMAFAHYDLWHGTAANTSDAPRHMIKFLFRRTGDNKAPTWNHEADALNKPRDWNLLDKAEDAGNIMSFGNPLKVSQSDHYKERAIRQECWNYLMGNVDS